MSAAVASRRLWRFIASPNIARQTRPQNFRFTAPNSARIPKSRTFGASTRTLDKRFTEDHEWVELAGDGKTGTIGISEYAAKALGDVVFVELPASDLEVSQGESIGAVESVKSASDIMSPVSGKITEANHILEEKPGMINQSPEQDGWLARIQLSDPSELDSLMDREGYQKFTEEADSH